MLRNPLEGITNPVTQAADIRHSLLVAIQQNLPIELAVSPEIMACLIGMPQKVFQENNFQALIINAPGRTQFIKADSAEIAMQAFRNWRDDPAYESKTSYDEPLYRSLYSFVQAASSTIPPEELSGLPTLFVILEAERDQNLASIAERFACKGDIEEQDVRIIHARLRAIWNQLPQGIKDKMRNLSPDNLF